MALEFFASRYLRPKYGNAVGMDSTFALHNRIDTAVVGVNQVTIIATLRRRGDRPDGVAHIALLLADMGLRTPSGPQRFRNRSSACRGASPW